MYNVFMPGNISTSLIDDLPAFSQTWRASVFQALQVVRYSASYPGNPITAAFLSVLFLQLDDRDSLHQLSHWLVEYIEPFIHDDPRNQSDQPDKILAAAVYLNICDRSGIEILVPVKRLSTYINYAASQSWFNKPLVAYYCSYLQESLTVQDKVVQYFEENYLAFIENQYIPGIAQALTVLGNALDVNELKQGTTLLANILSKQDVSINHVSWAVLAMAGQDDGLSNQRLTSSLTDLLDTLLLKELIILGKDLQLPTLITLMQASADQLELEEFVEHIVLPRMGHDLQVTMSHNEEADITLNVSLKYRQSMDRLSLTDMSLALAALCQSNRHRLIGIQESEASWLRTLLFEVKQLRNKGAIVLPRREYTIHGCITIIVTLLLGIYLAALVSGVTFRPSADLTSADFLDWDTIAFLAGLTTILFVQFRALYLGRTISSSIQQIPLLKLFVDPDKQTDFEEHVRKLREGD